jgi:L-lactate dehydrogenase (cytochrome)
MRWDRAMPVVTNVEDLRRMARRRFAKAISEYVDRGSYDEQTLRANRADGEILGVRPRSARRAR